MREGCVRRSWYAVGAAILLCASESQSAEDAGKALLERNCGRCHAVTADAPSRLKNAPNLWDTLRSYQAERLEFELAEGIGSRHSAMPQIQFSSEEISVIQTYLLGE